MSRPQHNRAASNIENWLDGQYEYIAPDKDTGENKRNSSDMPWDAYRDHTPERSDGNSSRGKGHRSSKDHKRTQDRYKPVTPPPEDALEREGDRHKGRSSRTHSRDRGHGVDREERRPRHDRETKYPPKADRGRPRRPPLYTATTSPYMPNKEEDTDARPRHRRYSVSSSPPRHRGDKSSRHHHSRRHEDRSLSPPPRSSRKKEDRERDARSHHSGTTNSTKDSKPRRPTLSRSYTAPQSKDAKKSSFSTRALSFWNDPRFRNAAEAALSAGATAAVAAAGQSRGDMGSKVLRASLGAAALGALKSPSKEPEPAEPPAPPLEKAGNVTGRYLADHAPVARKGSTRSRRHR